MIFSLKLTIIHHSIGTPIIHEHKIESKSKDLLLKKLDLTKKQKQDLKAGMALWKDKRGAIHKLELTKEE